MSIEWGTSLSTTISLKSAPGLRIEVYSYGHFWRANFHFGGMLHVARLPNTTAETTSDEAKLAALDYVRNVVRELGEAVGVVDSTAEREAVVAFLRGEAIRHAGEEVDGWDVIDAVADAIESGEHRRQS
jgi:hypothetical protein